MHCHQFWSLGCPSFWHTRAEIFLVSPRISEENLGYPRKKSYKSSEILGTNSDWRFFLGKPRNFAEEKLGQIIPGWSEIFRGKDLGTFPRKSSDQLGLIVTFFPGIPRKRSEVFHGKTPRLKPRNFSYAYENELYANYYQLFCHKLKVFSITFHIKYTL